MSLCSRKSFSFRRSWNKPAQRAETCRTGSERVAGVGGRFDGAPVKTGCWRRTRSDSPGVGVFGLEGENQRIKCSVFIVRQPTVKALFLQLQLPENWSLKMSCRHGDVPSWKCAPGRQRCPLFYMMDCVSVWFQSSDRHQNNCSSLH